LWHSGKTNSRSELDLGLFDGHVVKRARGRMENIDGGAEPIAWYD
jgi:hypothetical protein